MTFWIDTHCHLDAPEFGDEAAAVRARAEANGVEHCILPAVQLSHFGTVARLAELHRYSYGLGIHPLCVAEAAGSDLAALDRELEARAGDPRLVAVGEIGLDLFVPELRVNPLLERQEFFYREQLKLARKHGLPVILHVRRSAYRLLKHLRELAPAGGWSGTAHAFNGSRQQAEAFIGLGFKLGFGGSVTYERALQIRELAATLPLEVLVMETDAPDIPPHWLYRSAEERAAGAPQGRNEPAELPRIAATIAGLRGITTDELAAATSANAIAAFPRLAPLLAAAAR